MYSCAYRKSPTSVVRGFTLLEMALTLTIIGMLTAVAVPSYFGFITGERAGAAARRITTDLATAQRRARTTSQSQTVRFSPAASTYRLVGMPDPDNSAMDYIVHLTDPPYEASIVSVDLGGDYILVYDGYGTPDSGGTIVLHVGRQQRTITIDASGTAPPTPPIQKAIYAQ